MNLHALIRGLSTGSILTLIGVSPLAHADLQDDLNARWRGAWVIVTGELYSNCNGQTTDNRINGDLISGNGRFAFAPGELARVTRVDARRRRVDVFLDIYEGMLIEYEDGPFTLYREVSCPVELLVEYGGTRTRDLGVAGVEEQFNSRMPKIRRTGMGASERTIRRITSRHLPLTRTGRSSNTIRSWSRKSGIPMSKPATCWPR
jgi:hypothetical protein